MPPASPERASPWGTPLLLSTCALALALAVARATGLVLPDAVAWALLLALVAVIAVGVRWPASGVFARPILAMRTDRPWVALTFDDGPHPQHTPHVLHLLAGTPHRATFFVIGRHAEQHPDLLAEVVRQGHLLGNHSYHHAYMTPALPVARLTAELNRASDLVQKVTGLRPRWFRPPVGLVTPPVAAAAARAGLDMVVWSATARDGVAWADVDAGLARLTAGLRPGAILVLHDGVKTKADSQPAVYTLLPRLLAELDARGLTSVTLDQLLTP